MFKSKPKTQGKIPRCRKKPYQNYPPIEKESNGILQSFCSKFKLCKKVLKKTVYIPHLLCWPSLDLSARHLNVDAAHINLYWIYKPSNTSTFFAVIFLIAVKNNLQRSLKKFSTFKSWNYNSNFRKDEEGKFGAQYTCTDSLIH